MSKKIIDEMIAEVLSEKSDPSFDIRYKKGRRLKVRPKPDLAGDLGTPNTKSVDWYKKLAKAGGEKVADGGRHIQPKDFGALLDDGADIAPFKFVKKNTTNQDWKDALEDVYNIKFPPSGTDIIDKDNDGTPDDIEKNIGDLDSGLISDPRTYNIGAAQKLDTETNKRPQAQFPSSLRHTFSSLLSSAPSLRDRLIRLNEYSDAMVSGNMDKLKSLVGITDSASAENKRALLNACLSIDYIAAIAKNMDNQSASYIFESFLALVCGGVQSGGDNKAGDFLMSNGSAGSAKYHKNKSGASQAVSGFTKNTKVTYVHAVKASAGGGQNTDPNQLTSVDLYLYDITFTSLGDVMFNNEQKATKSPKVKEAQLPIFTTNNASAVIETTKSKDKSQFIYKVNFTIPPGKAPDATIYLATDKSASFLSSLNTTMTKDTDLKTAYDMMRNFFKETIAADNSIRKYIATKDNNAGITAGEEALNAMDRADTNLQQMLGAVGVASDKEIKGEKGHRTISESKFESLDQLIAETLRDIKESIK